MQSAAPVSSADPVVVVRAEGGVLSCCATTGFIAGVNVTARPRALNGVEVGGDATVGRFGGFSLLYFSADATYGRRVGTITPYGGGGVGIAKTGSGGPTNTGAQLIAGIELPAGGRHRIRVEVRFLFLPVETTFVLGSISF